MDDDIVILDDDATSTFRGFRRQALYILYRILTDCRQPGLVYVPELKEDLTILNDKKDIIEIAQVKDYLDPLYLSTFKPKKENSFFHRMVQQIGRTPDVTVKIVSFGPVSDQLSNGFSGNKQHQNNLAQTLADYKFNSFEKYLKVVKLILIDFADEQKINDEINEILKTSFIGIDHKSAFDLLLYYIYECSEHKTEITYDVLFDKINSIGRFFTERKIYQKEWFANIKPFSDLIKDEDSKKLEKEFYMGVAARYDHICENLDVIRSCKLQKLHEAFSISNIVIIHGASGQGKSVLALRYFHDYLSGLMSYKVFDIDNSSHAHIISEALISQYDALGIPFYVQFDVAPSNPYWLNFLRHISSYQNIKVLITVREEDWKRASITNYEFDFKDIELDFNEEEAESIFNKFTQKRPAKEFLTFADCWAIFGGTGPLLEFVYLLSQGETLQARLEEQVNNLKDMCRTGTISKAELNLLRMIAIVSSFEGRLDIRILHDSIDLPEMGRSLELFEKEYLIKKADTNQFLIGGLHPIRSAILSQLLTDNTYNRWIDLVKVCFSAIYEQDVEYFLLYAFSRREKDRTLLIEFLQGYSPRRWLTYSGIIHALLWVGVKLYVDENMPLIEEIYEKEQDSYNVIFNFDITSAIQMKEPWWKTIGGIPEEQYKVYEEYQKKQTDPHRAFIPLQNWLHKNRKKPVKPISHKDVLGIAETIFWADFLHQTIPIFEWDVLPTIDSIFDTLSLEALSDFMLGISLTKTEKIKKWYSNHFKKITELLFKKTRVVAIEQDDTIIKAHFYIPLDIDGDSESYNFHEQTILVLDYITKLFPFYQTYSSQGHGHKAFSEVIDYDHDDTYKNIERNRYPNPWLISVNSILSELMGKPFKLKTWQDYVDFILKERIRVIQNFEALLKGLNSFYKNMDGSAIIRDGIDVKEWYSCLKLIESDPGLPSCVLDEWGVLKDFPDSDKGNEIIAISNYPALQKYREFSKSKRDYFFFVKCFFWNANKVLPDFIKNLFYKGNYQLPVFNYTDAIKKLPEFQKRFSALFQNYYNSVKVKKLEEKELDVYKKLWATWYHITYHPTHKKNNAVLRCFNIIHISFITDFKKRLLKKANNADKKINFKIIGDKIPLEEKPTLWIQANSEVVYSLDDVSQIIIKSIDEVVREKGACDQIGRILYYHWNYICVLWSFKGRIALPIIHRVSTIASINRNLKVFQMPLTDDVMKSLAIQKWDNDRMRKANLFLTSFYKLKIWINHFGEFLQIPDSEIGSNENLQNYAQKTLNSSFKPALQDICKVLPYFSGLLKNVAVETFSAEDENLVYAIEILINFYNKILQEEDRSDGYIELRFDKETIPKWKNRIEEMEPDINTAYGILFLNCLTNLQ